MSFDSKLVKRQLDKAFDNNSEVELLKILKNNSFLFYKLYERKFSIQPNFAEVPFGSTLRSDFCWLNDNSDGPEWVLVEIESPEMKLFTKNGEPSSKLNHAIEQVTSWERYFEFNPAEKAKIFGAVSRFRFILVAGRRRDWASKNASLWRTHYKKNSNIEIHSTDIFYDSVDHYSKFPGSFWSFEENPVSLRSKELQRNWESYQFIQHWRNILN